MIHRIRLGALLLLTAVTIGCANQPADIADREGVLIHVKSGPDEPHAVLMALRMAQMMSSDHDVLVYFDVDAVRVVAADAPDLRTDPFPSSHTILADLAERGVTLYACPGCLKVAGIEPDELMPGITVAEKSKFFGFTQGRIITLDY